MNLTLQYDQVMFILEPNAITRSLARKRVTVIDYPDGRLVKCPLQVGHRLPTFALLVSLCHHRGKAKKWRAPTADHL